MHIIGVLDVRSGVALHAAGGRRAEYGPLSSVLAPGSDPVVLARAMRDVLGLGEVYVADLDAITDGTPDLGLYHALAGEGLGLLVDCGMRETAPEGPWRVVAGLETLAGPEALREGLVFSLDLRGGVPLAGPGWREGPRAIVAEAVRRGVRSVIVLDLARVGGGAGVGTEGLLAWMRAEYPGLEIIAGGGVSGVADLERLASLGIDGALVGSALHDGRLGRRELVGLACHADPGAAYKKQT